MNESLAKRCLYLTFCHSRIPKCENVQYIESCCDASIDRYTQNMVVVSHVRVCIHIDCMRISMIFKEYRASQGQHRAYLWRMLKSGVNGVFESLQRWLMELGSWCSRDRKTNVTLDDEYIALPSCGQGT